MQQHDLFTRMPIPILDIDLSRQLLGQFQLFIPASILKVDGNVLIALARALLAQPVRADHQSRRERTLVSPQLHVVLHVWRDYVPHTTAETVDVRAHVRCQRDWREYGEAPAGEL